MARQVIQWNTRKSLRAIDHIRTILKEQDTLPIIALQEPHSYKKNLFKMKNYVIHGIQSNLTRACLAIPKDVNFTFLSELSNSDIAVGKFDNKETYLASVYMDILVDPISDKLEQLVQLVNSKKATLILCMDTNAHSVLWGEKRTNYRGSLVEEFIVQNDLKILNQGNIPTYERKNARSIIDITLCNKSDIIQDWRVNPDLVESDHRIIQFAIEQCETVLKVQRNYKKANWQKFKNLLSMVEFVHDEKWSQETIEIHVNKLEGEIRKALDIVAPEKKTKIRTDDPEWLSQEILDMRKHLKKLHKKWTKSQEDIYYEEFSSYRKEYFKKIRQAKRSSWAEFCNNTDTIESMSKLNKILQSKSQKTIDVIRYEGKTSNDPEEAAEFMLKAHFSCGKSVGHKDNMEAISIKSFDYSWISADKIKEEIASFKPYKAVADKDFKPIVLQNLPNNIIKGIMSNFQGNS